MYKILLAEDDRDFGYILKKYLEINNYEVIHALNGEEALDILQKNNFDICILDVMMPKMDGFELGKKIQKKHAQLPFIYLTAKLMKEDVIKGLEIGADDYITKPFEVDELLLRVKNVLRRFSKIEEEKNQEIELGKYLFIPKSFELIFNDDKKILTERESELLLYLFDNKGRVISKEEILEKYWEEVDFFSKRSLDVFISKLRKYLSKDENLKIESLRGIGIRFIV